MKNSLRLLITGCLVSYSATAFAISGTNITIYDDNSKSTSTWYNNAHGEDQEVEPGNEIGQKWDLEGFFLNDSLLTLVGGFNFKNGESIFKGGDIFIDVTGDAKYGSDVTSPYSGNGYKTTTNTLGYDYVVDLKLDGTILKYAIIALDSDSRVSTPLYKSNYGSGPFEYIENGNIVSGYQNAVYKAGLSDQETGFAGDYYSYCQLIKTHNALTVDLTSLFDIIGYGKKFTVSYTMGCGNDHMVGSGTSPVPEPATMLLFGTGLVGFAGIARRRMRS